MESKKPVVIKKEPDANGDSSKPTPVKVQQKPAPVRKVKVEPAPPSKRDPPADDASERQARAKEVHMMRLASLEEIKRQSPNPKQEQNKTS